MTNSNIEIEKMIKQYQISPKALLGQHFIVDTNFLNKMVDEINISTVVIEIGPGLGQLTEALAHKAKKVIAIEVDKQFEKPLGELRKKYGNIELIFEDALSGNLEKLVSREKKLDNKVCIVSNLPYHITEPFINKLTKLGNIEAILMVGKKFGYQSQVEKPTDLNFNELSYICRSFFKIEKVVDVPKKSFWPIPKTDSVILKFIPKESMPLTNQIDYISQYIILGQKQGILIKNALMKAIQDLEKRTNGIYLTKNKSREIIQTLMLPSEILNKSFSQLNNKEVKVLANSLKNFTLT